MKRTRHSSGPREGKSLIDWNEPASHSGRERAHHFGLLPVEDGGELDGPVVEPVDRRLEEEEPEAFEEQHFDFTTDALSPADVAESPVRGVSHDDVDLVRLYLRNIGERKL